MIYIACALYDEAVPWIKALKLKKNTAASKFQIFESEAAYLAVTGTGMMNAAVALTYLCTLHMPGKHDIFVNTGVCGAAKECGAPGSLYLIHKITGASSGRSYYPDILYGHPFSEGAVTSFFAVQEQIPDGQLADMEAEGLWCAASTFFAPDQMLFFKYISDFGGGMVTRENVRHLSNQAVGAILPWLEENFLRAEKFYQAASVGDAACKLCDFVPDGQLPGKILEQADSLLLHFKATQAMRGQLFSHLYYCCLCGRDVSGLLEAVTSEPCRSKKDGMARFRALLKDLKTGV